MSSNLTARIGTYIVRWPQAGAPVFLCSRQAHSVPVPGYDGTSYQCPPSMASAPKQQKQTFHRTKIVTDELKIAESCRYFRRFITDPSLIDKILKCFAPCGSSTAPIIMDCNPGPGILTQAFLDAGHKVFALETNSDFLPSLERIQGNANEQLKVVHCDFFRIDPWSDGLVQPPSMYASTLMKTLNISEVPWASDVPLKVFLMLGHKKEQLLLWRHLYSLYQRLSVFRFGRVEVNVFMSEKQYLKLASRPGDFVKYKALSVLFQAACDIELLHMEPMSSFLTPTKFQSPSMTKSMGSPDNKLCLVRITPRRNLFSETFTPADGITFVNIIKQFLAKRKSKLMDKLDNMTLGNGKDLIQSLALPADIVTGCIYPEEYKLLFEILLRSEEFNRSFVCDDFYEDIAVTSY